MLRTADLCDQYINEIDVSDAILNSYGGKRIFSGTITTVRISGNNNEALVEAIENAEPGSVIVVDGDIGQPCAWMGGRVAGIASNRGITGIIVNGSIRDVEEICNLEMGVMALGTHPCPSRHKRKKGAIGERDTVLNFGGVNWKPGHYVYVDSDGIVISPINLSFID